jgi:NAD(P)-dependent dehydrogenase (short-subunit alcohol dehydrogenase family)
MFAQVIAVCRKSSPGLIGAHVARVLEDVDVSQDTGITRLKTQLEGENIDLLINNAGIFLVCLDARMSSVVAIYSRVVT